MEFGSSLPLDLLALVDPATRGAAPPLVFKPGDASGGGSALPFELCLELLEPAGPSGETLPLPGNPLPVAFDEDLSTDIDAAEALALTLPGLLPAPVVGGPPTVGGGAPAAAVEAAATPVAPSGGVPLESGEAVAAPSLAARGAVAASALAEAQDPLPTETSAAGEVAENRAAVAAATTAVSTAGTNAGLAAIADADADTAPAATSTTMPGVPGEPRASGTATQPLATDADYAAEAAALAPRAEPGAGLRRNDEPARGPLRNGWRDAVQMSSVQTSQSSQTAVADSADGALPPNAPAATPFVAAMRGSAEPAAAAATTATAPVAETGAAPGWHSALHAATVQHAPTAAHSAAATATPDGPPVDTTTPRWQEAFASRVQWLADQNIGEAHLRLNPPELGAVDVKISLVDDRTFVQLTTHTTAARDELAQSLPRLRELFTASGLDLGGASVATGRDGQARSDGAPAEHAYPSRQGFAPGGDGVTAATAPSRRGAAGASRIDLFA